MDLYRSISRNQSSIALLLPRCLKGKLNDVADEERHGEFDDEIDADTLLTDVCGKAVVRFQAYN